MKRISAADNIKSASLLLSTDLNLYVGTKRIQCEPCISVSNGFALGQSGTLYSIQV
jgi:hypothetical protein